MLVKILGTLAAASLILLSPVEVKAQERGLIWAPAKNLSLIHISEPTRPY